MTLCASNVGLSGELWKLVCVEGAFQCIQGNALLSALSANAPRPFKKKKQKKKQVAYSHLIGHDTAIHLTELKNPTYAYARVS